MAPLTVASVAQGLRLCGIAVALTLLAAAPVCAQAISGHTSSTAGSTANTGDGSSSVRSSTQNLIVNATTYQSRYAWNISADTGIFSTRDRAGSAQHNMSFNVTAPGGYRLDVAQSRQGIVQRRNDAFLCNGQADISSLTGSQGGGTLTSGTLSLADPGSVGNGTSDATLVVNQTANGSIGAVSNGASVPHTLTFTWNGTTRSNSCEAAVRMGEGTSVTSCPACEYPGNPSRTQANDGHFVTVTLVNLCGNGVVDSASPWLEQCDPAIPGSVCCNANCTFNTGNVCRPSTGVCDPQEVCGGALAGCPANVLSPTSTVCRPAADVCDAVENCDGVSGPCPADALQPNSTVCRASAGVCDIAENCTGSSIACPGDTVATAATVCRAVAGVCDIAENCDGTNVACPADDFESSAVTCRAVAGVCDVAENCTDTGPDCPADAFESNAVVCRPSIDVCDTTDNCSGSMAACPPDAVEPTTTVCRPAATTADAPETCDAVNYACPPNAFLPAGTPCDDGSFCTQTDEADGFGVCVGMDPVDCDDTNPCTDEVCDSQGGGFLCLYTNNGLCVGPNCGNFVVDAGETCDPPNLALDPVTNQVECRLDCTACGDGVVQANNVETCDDGNTISGCRPDKPQKPLDSCLNNCNEPICADPARIKFGAQTLPDQFSFHGRLISPVPLDFVNNHVVIELQNSNREVIYRSSLLRGLIEIQNPKSVRYKNFGARSAGGMYQLKAKAASDHYVLSLKAYGDLTNAVADMSTHVYIGADEWVIRGLWTQGPNGWKLTSKSIFLPVQ